MNDERNEEYKDLNEKRMASALEQSCSGADATPGELAAIRAKLPIPRPAASSRVRIYLFATIVAAAAAMLFAVLLGFRQPQSVEVTPADDDAPGEALPPGALKRFGTARRMERLTNTSFAFSPDGKEMIAACRDGAMRVWDLKTGKERLCVHPKEKDGRFTAVRWSPDGGTIAGAADFDVYAWSAKDGKELLRDGDGLFQNGMMDLSFDRSSKRLASACADGHIVVWDLSTGKRVLEKENGDPVYAGALSPDGKTLVYGENVGQGKGPLVFLDLASGKTTARADEHRSWINTIRFSPDGSRIATSSHDGTVVFWDAEKKTLIRRMAAAGATYDAVFSPDGKTVVSAGRGKTMEFWSVPEGKRTRSMELESSFEKRELAFTPDGKSMGVLTDRFSLMELSADSDTVPSRGHDAGVAKVAFSGDGTGLVSGSYDGTLRLWKLSSGEGRTLEFSMNHSPNRFAMDAAGHCFAVDQGSNAVGIWDPVTGVQSRRIPIQIEEDKRIRYLCFSEDGKILFVHGWDHAVNAVDPASGRVLWRRALDRDVKAMMPSPGGVTCILGRPVADQPGMPSRDDFSVEAFDGRTGEPNTVLRGASTRDLCFDYIFANSEGERLALGWTRDGQGRICLALMNPAACAQFAAIEIEEKGNILSADSIYADASADGRLLAEARENALGVWEVASGRLLERFSGHDDMVISVALAPDGRSVATGSYDTTILLWGLGRAPAPEGLDARWAALKADAGPGTLAAVYALAGDGARAVPYLAEHMQPQAKPSLEEVKRLLSELADERFEVRERAAEKLAVLAGIDNALEATRAEAENAELRERLDKVLAELRNPVVRDAGLLQAVRGVWVLELIGSADAQNVLRILAGGVPDGRLTREAAAALARLEKRPK